ncbi:MAG: hypothetical protein GX386_04625 [Clostridiaceae bacterium]|jgi:hypothetical protein|nr:hypothetical protein [Clostridiaceae bacterium]
MNIGILLPAEKKWWKPVTHKTYSIEVAENLNLMVCLLPVNDITNHRKHRLTPRHTCNHRGWGDLFSRCDDSGTMRIQSLRKRYKAKIDRIIEELNIWPILGHPDISSFYQVDTSVFSRAVKELAIHRFDEVLKAIKGVGALIKKEILVTGSSEYLEHAIEILITKVKTVNILIPEGVNEPVEAEKAFLETGIPVHITTDCSVINRTAIWIRFPYDHESFDNLPRNFKGIIVDFGAMKIIDTKARKVFNIGIDFSDKIKRRLGQQLLSTWEKNVLEGFIILACANAWDINEPEVFKRLDLRFSFIS